MLDDLRGVPEAGRLTGEIDIAVAAAVGVQLRSVAIRTEAMTVEFDCERLTFIDASGITMLLRVAEESGKRVRLVNLTPSCRRVFEILDLCERFGIEEPMGRDELERLPVPA